MQLQNPFPLEVRLLYLYNYECWICGSNGSSSGGLELHHIFGRISASAFNSAPLCNGCHIHIGHTVKEHQLLLKKTIHFLIAEKYKPKISDYEFLNCVQESLIGFEL